MDDRPPTAPSEASLDYRLLHIGDETSLMHGLHPLIIERLILDSNWANATTIVRAIRDAIEEYIITDRIGSAVVTPEIKAAWLRNYIVSLIIDDEVQRRALNLVVKGYPAEV